MRVTEDKIGKAVLRILAALPTGSATIARLKRDIPEHLALSAEDGTASPTRNGEEVWEQQVRNLVSHRTVPGNIICEGLASYSKSRITITDAGKLYVNNGKSK